jgi:hypothetical protein
MSVNTLHKGDDDDNNNNNTSATYLESTTSSNYSSHIWHCTHTAESANVKVQHIQHGK